MSMFHFFGRTLLLSGLGLFGCALNTQASGDGSATPEALAAVQAGTCTSDCTGRSCGLDPVCGVSCGSCATGQACDDTSGQCRAECVPDCSGRTCGLDPVCGVSCGSCGEGESCNDASGQCGPSQCVPDCRGRTCGLDPLCGVSCGSCHPGYTCDANAGVCEPEQHACGGSQHHYPKPW